MTCKHCGREIAERVPLGAIYEDDLVLVHLDTQLCVCDGDARFRPGYFDAPHAEAAEA